LDKGTVTRWYIGAWVVWVVSILALILLARREGASGPALGTASVYVLILGSAFVMFTMWVVALVKLARRHAMFSFVVMLVLQLLGIGIVGMVLYAISGPEDVADFAVRPRVT
jgi:cytochrome bd-type quinol oxidase subunit 2